MIILDFEKIVMRNDLFEFPLEGHYIVTLQVLHIRFGILITLFLPDLFFF